MPDDDQQIPPISVSTEQLSRQPSFEGQREQGGCLTSVLILFSIIAFSSIFSVFMEIIHPLRSFDRSIFPFISLILAIVDLISIYGVWKWKKWGVKLLVIAYVLGALISVITEITLHTYDSLFHSGFSITSAVGGLAVDILIFLSFYLEIKKRWHYFS